jgi:DNA polymerase III epsilon subunit-like protein
MNNAVLFLDTETTGLVRRNVPLTHESQPRLAQLGLSLQTPSGRRLASCCFLVWPDGWQMPPDAARVNGLSTELLQGAGLKVSYAWHMFATLARRASAIVAHNVDFDRTILEIERLRMTGVAELPERPWECTKELAAPVLKLPLPQGGNRYPERAKQDRYKWPSLDEAHRALCGGPVAGAHDALADAEACARIYWALQPGNRTEEAL